MDGAVAFQGGLGGVPAPDQVISGFRSEPFRFAAGHLNRHGCAALQAAGIQGRTTGEGGTTLGTGAGTSGAPIKSTLRATATEARALRSTATETGPILAETLTAARFTTSVTATIAAQAVASEPIGAGGIKATLRAARSLTALGAIAAALALSALRTPLTTGSKGTGAAPGGATARTPLALALVPAAIETGVHGQQGKGIYGSASSRCASSWPRRLGFCRNSQPTIVSNPVARP